MLEICLVFLGTFSAGPSKVSEMRDTMFFIAKKVGVAEKNTPRMLNTGGP